MGKQYAKSNKVAEGPGNSLSFNIRLGPTLCEETGRTHTQPLPTGHCGQTSQGSHLVYVLHWSIKMPHGTCVTMDLKGSGRRRHGGGDTEVGWCQKDERGGEGYDYILIFKK